MHKTETGTDISMTDQEIISRIRNGEKDLYSIIVRRYNQRLYRVGMAIIQDDAEAEDALQTAYINAYVNLEKFRSRSAFSTWLTRILINECLLRLKKRKQSINMNDDNMEKAVHQKNGSPGTPVSALINSELGSILEKAIRRLPEIYRTVFVMRELEDMTVAETGDCLSISEVNVKVRLNRARIMLRKFLEQSYNKEDILHFHLNRCNRVTEAVMKKIGSF